MAEIARKGQLTMSRDPDPALEVLRAVWDARGQNREELEAAFGPAKTCKRMAGVGFGELAQAGEEDGIRDAWRARLQREGKLSEHGSVADLVLRPAETRG
jgi:hypothetical protein